MSDIGDLATAATPAEPAGDETPDTHYELRRADVLCGLGLLVGIVASYVFIPLSPRLLAHHGILLEALNGSVAAIVSGAAFARIGRDSLTLVILAPICTIALYDVFFWWAGRLWGDKVAAFYTKNNPGAAKWINRSERLVRRFGIWALITGFYLPIPNQLIYVSCGVSGMSLGIFVLGDLIGLMLFEALLVGLGWAIGHRAVHIVNEINHYSLRISIALVVVVIAVNIVRQRRRRPPKAPAGGYEAAS